MILIAKAVIYYSSPLDYYEIEYNAADSNKRTYSFNFFFQTT